MEKTFDQFFADTVAQLPGYEPRPQQVHMAERILDTMANGGHLLIEAGTGSGKSFGYLLPAIHAGKTIVISTGTINLQEQLIEKDLPFLLKATGSPMTVALAKGRSNYLCRQKLWEADRQIPTNDPLRRDLNRIMGVIEDWDGDLANLPFAPENRFWTEIASTSDDCLGNKCEFFDQNPFRVARVKLGKADIIVANHALYMVDLATGGGILPEHDMVIFDEAHHLPRVAGQAFTATIGRYALTKLLQKIRRRWQPAPDALSFRLIDVESRLADWLWRHDRSQFRLYPDSDFLSIAEAMIMGLGELRQWLENGQVDELLFPDLEVKSKAPLHRPKLVAQLANLIARWEFFANQAEVAGKERVNWVELNSETGYFELLSAPLDVSRELSELLWKERTAVLTSATLSVDGDFSYYRSQLGLPSTTGSLCLPSPFDYAQQARLFVPRLPEPNDPRYERASHQTIAGLIEASQGRAFVLFTSYRAMKSAYQALANDIRYPCRQQGDLPRTKLVSWFKETPGAVLFATSSFWEGVDVPGAALSCVIIDRLPFAVPDDPLVQAYVERLKAQGRDWFREFTLPEAILRLKQGFGRLIRTGTDTGVVAILDARLHTKSYGRQILKALPNAPRVESLDTVADWLGASDKLPF